MTGMDAKAQSPEAGLKSLMLRASQKDRGH